MSKVLWVFIQSFKIRGKKKAKRFVLLNVFQRGVVVFFFCTGNSKRCLGRAVYRFFRMGKGMGSMMSRLPCSTAELRDKKRCFRTSGRRALRAPRSFIAEPRRHAASRRALMNGPRSGRG